MYQALSGLFVSTSPHIVQREVAAYESVRELSKAGQAETHELIRVVSRFYRQHTIPLPRLIVSANDGAARQTAELFRERIFPKAETRLNAALSDLTLSPEWPDSPWDVEEYARLRAEAARSHAALQRVIYADEGAHARLEKRKEMIVAATRFLLKETWSRRPHSIMFVAFPSVWPILWERLLPQISLATPSARIGASYFSFRGPRLEIREAATLQVRD